MYKAVALVLCVLFAASAQGKSLRHSKHLSARKIFPTGKIVGGEDTDITDIPYQIQLEFLGYQICGGSILSENYVLTAAHCTDGSSANLLQIRYGTNQLNKGGKTVQVSKIFQNPDFDYFEIDYDVSVLELEEPIALSKSAQPIGLASQEPAEGEPALVSGWGNLEEGGDQPNQLQSVIVPVVDRDECNQAYDDTITERMICAGVAGKDSCQGDSGGPLVTNGTQSGIVSWGYGCAEAGFPGVYSNVASLRDFIDQSTKGEAQWI